MNYKNIDFTNYKIEEIYHKAYYIVMWLLKDRLDVYQGQFIRGHFNKCQVLSQASESKESLKLELEGNREKYKELFQEIKSIHPITTEIKPYKSGKCRVRKSMTHSVDITNPSNKVIGKYKSMIPNDTISIPFRVSFDVVNGLELVAHQTLIINLNLNSNNKYSKVVIYGMLIKIIKKIKKITDHEVQITDLERLDEDFKL